MVKPNLTTLQATLGYQFNDKSLLNQALTHRSFARDHNERLEYLGDSLLNFFIAENIFQRFPNADEGELSRLRARLVKGETLATIASRLGLGEYLRLGSGELKSGGKLRAAGLADVVEALVAAIYLDSDITTTRNCLFAWYGDILLKASPAANAKDPKTRLQELLQGLGKPLPRYTTVKTHGQQHEQVFVVACQVQDVEQTFTGEASSRRKAEQQAAANALLTLEAQHD